MTSRHLLASVFAIGVFLAPAYPSFGKTTWTAAELVTRAIERRAVEAAVWGMPAVNYDLMRQEMLTKTAAKENEVVYWGKPLDWYNQTLTPNPDAIYLVVFYNTKDVGPVVVEVSAAGDDGSRNANFVRYDASFFDNLNRIIQNEPWLDRARAMIDPLRSVGIEKGKPFAPDKKTKQALASGMDEARQWLEAKYDGGFPPLWRGSRWMTPASPDLFKDAQSGFTNPNTYPTDSRGLSDKQSNWLPEPGGSFNLTMRFYGAQAPILDGSYRLPGVERVK